MLVMAKGMQKGFIFLWPIQLGYSLTRFSVAVLNECIPPIAEPIRQPLRVTSSVASSSSPLAKGSFAECSAFFAATIW